MFILAIVLLINVIGFSDDTKWVKHTNRVIHEVEHLQASMIDQETGMRGFLATGNTEYLEPYNVAIQEFDEHLSDLKELVSDNPSQVIRLENIEKLANKWHEEASDIYLAIKYNIISGINESRELNRHTTSGIGKQKMDSIRILVSGINDKVLELSILNDLINMETGIRAYIINKEDKYLEPYFDGRKSLTSNLDKVNDPVLNQAINDWKSNVAEKSITLVKSSLKFRTEEDLQNVISNGLGKKYMDQIRDEVNYIIAVEEELLTLRDKRSKSKYNATIITILIALLLTILICVLQLATVNRVTTPLANFSNHMKGFDLENINEEINVGNSELEEISNMIWGYRKILRELKSNMLQRERITWLQEGQMSISTVIESFTGVKELLDNLISYMTQRVNGHYGAIYLIDNSKENISYKLTSGYGLDDLNHIKQNFTYGEGLIGQAAFEKKIIHINDLTSENTTINSGTITATPSNLLLIPCIYNGEVIGVIEILSLSDFNERSKDFAQKIRNAIGIAINNAMNLQEVKRLLDETKESNLKLQTQQEELRVTNEELETQSTALINSQSELEAQQESLRVANEELETNSKTLEEQKNILVEQNKELELSKKIIEEKTEDLLQSNKYKSEFLANMSHELRTPLNSILLLSELLNESDNLTEEEIKYAGTINNSGKGLLALINDILDLSKVEAGQVELVVEPMNLVDLKNDITCMFEQLSVTKNIDFNIHLSEKLPRELLVDEMKLKQIVNNLLSNAFKFTEKGLVKLDIRDDDDHVIFEVKDTGIGIAQDKLEFVFSAFKQEDGSTSRNYGGTGLGLSISLEYAKLMGGDILVESIKKKGSTFTLILPKENIIEPTSTPNKQTPQNIDTSSIIEEIDNTNTEEIPYIPDDRSNINPDSQVLLIIDDDPVFAKIIMKYAKDNGFKVIVAETGETGLYLADYYTPTGIILDIGLPGIDGLEVADRLRKNDRTKNIPINIVSGKDVDNRVHNLGVEFYQKPVEKSTIEKILNSTNASGNEINRVAIIGDLGIDQNFVQHTIESWNSEVEIIDCSIHNDFLDCFSKKRVDLVVINLENLSKDIMDLIMEIKESSLNRDISIIIYSNSDITIKDEFALRNYVSDIIIKDGNSTQRLMDEIKIFVHKVKEKKIAPNNNLNNEEFLDKTILLVDDDMRNIFAISSLLTKMGFDVEMANNGKEAIEVLENLENVDLVLMDIMMPVMNGYDAMKEIRNRQKFANLPIIALTAKAMKGDKETCIKAGANEYLSKPIDKNKLLSLLRVWL